MAARRRRSIMPLHDTERIVGLPGYQRVFTECMSAHGVYGDSFASHRQLERAAAVCHRRAVTHERRAGGVHRYRSRPTRRRRRR